MAPWWLQASLVDMSLAIIDYDAGNVTSVQRALQQIGHKSIITRDPAVIAAADRVIFPGVGAAESCMRNLQSGGMDQALKDAVVSGKPVLGICVGMQLMFEHSEEDGGVPCLGLLPGRVRRFEPHDASLKVPHMGWNPVQFTDNEALASKGEQAFYFVHSYYCEPSDERFIIARSDHGHQFCAGVRKDNLVAVQFHPEKSGPVGLTLLRQFCQA